MEIEKIVTRVSLCIIYIILVKITIYNAFAVTPHFGNVAIKMNTSHI